MRLLKSIYAVLAIVTQNSSSIKAGRNLCQNIVKIRQQKCQIFVFAPVAAPNLQFFDPTKVFKILKEQEHYKLEIETKKAGRPFHRLRPNKAGIAHALLDKPVFMKAFEAIPPNADSVALSDGDVEKYNKSEIGKGSVMYDPAVTKRALHGLQILIKTSNAEARVAQYCSDFFTRLNGVGYAKFRKEDFEQAVSILMKNVYSLSFKDEMIKCTDIDN